MKQEFIKVIEKELSLNSKGTFFVEDLIKEVREQIKKEFNTDILPSSILEMPENHTTYNGKFYFYFRVKADLTNKIKELKKVRISGLMPPMNNSN